MVRILDHAPTSYRFLDSSGMLSVLFLTFEVGAGSSMGTKYFTEEQMAFALRPAESGTTVGKIVRELGISERAFYRWKKRFAGRAVQKGLHHHQRIRLLVWKLAAQDEIDEF